MGHRIELTLVTVTDCEHCTTATELVRELMGQNRAVPIELHLVDADIDPEGVLRSGATSHPTLVLAVDGREKARLTGTLSKRRVLRKLLPHLYPDDEAALRALRRQLGSPTETFPASPIRVRRSAKVRLLAEVPLFAGLTKRQLGHVARLVDEIHRDPDEHLTEQGDAGDEFFIVVDGSVDILRNGRKVATLGPGDCFGEMSLLDDLPRSATAVTRTATTLLAIHRSDFERTMQTDPSIMRALLATLSMRLR